MHDLTKSQGSLTKSELVLSLAGIPDGDPILDRVSAILLGSDAPERPPSLRLFRICEVVRACGLSRSTVYRLIEAGRLRTVTIRPGAAPRIPENELRRLVERAYE